MNNKIEKTIGGQSVTAQPVYKHGGTYPAYWACAINERIQPKRFRSAPEVFRFVEKHGARRRA